MSEMIIPTKVNIEIMAEVSAMDYLTVALAHLSSGIFISFPTDSIFIVLDLFFAESKFVRYREDIFNTLNHPGFALPGQSLCGLGFGTIGSATSERIT